MRQGDQARDDEGAEAGGVGEQGGRRIDREEESDLQDDELDVALGDGGNLAQDRAACRPVRGGCWGMI